MENASKALTMAGSVLIAMIVISLLVVFFNQLQNLQKTELNKEEVEQSAQFNETYDVYYRDVYGSELLSIANKIKDYNLREAEISGYTEIELEVNITKDIDKDLLKKGTYNSTQLIQKLKNIEDKIEEIETKSITFIKEGTAQKSSRKIKQLANMRTKDIEELGSPKEDYEEYVRLYNTYKTLLTQIKAQVFEVQEFKYDKNTGRITKMIYKL